jgi:hypothetical protein
MAGHPCNCSEVYNSSTYFIISLSRFCPFWPFLFCGIESHRASRSIQKLAHLSLQTHI